MTSVSPDRAAIEKQLIELIGELLYVEPETIDVDATFTEIGLDSILAAEYMAGVKNNFGLTVTVATLYAQETIRKFSEYLAERRAELGPDSGDGDGGQSHTSQSYLAS